MKAPTKRTIDGFEYTVFPMPARQASDALVRLARIVAPGAGSAIEKLSSGGVDETVLAGGIGSIVDRFTVEEKRYFEDAFMRTSSVRLEDGREPQLSEVFDVHFAGELGAWAQWMALCLEVNFAGFFTVLAARFAAALALGRAKLASSSASPKGSTGASGGSSPPTG